MPASRNWRSSRSRCPSSAARGATASTRTANARPPGFLVPMCVLLLAPLCPAKPGERGVKRRAGSAAGQAHALDGHRRLPGFAAVLVDVGELVGGGACHRAFAVWGW